MKLFTLSKEYQIEWEPQTLLIDEFSKIFKRDRTKGKTKANKELAFVWFFTDIKSDYQINTDPATRTEAIKADLKLEKSWKADKVVLEAIEFYDKMSTSITAKILKDSTYVAEELSNKMKIAVKEDLDIGEIGKLLDGIKKMPEVIKALQAAEKSVLQELKERRDKLGSKEKAMFEDLKL